MLDQIITAYYQADYVRSLNLSLQHLISVKGIELMHIIGLSLMQMRRSDEGFLFLKTALNFFPDIPELYYNSAHLLHDAAMPDELEWVCEQGLKRYPNDENLLRAKANLPYLRQQYAEAIPFYTSLIEKTPEDYQCHSNLADCYRALCNLDKAEHHLRIAEQLAPRDKGVQLLRAAMLSEMGRVDEAITQLERIDTPESRVLLGTNLLSRGELKRGWELWRDRWISKYMNLSIDPESFCISAEPIRGRRVRLIRESGYGDVFLFLRYVPELAKIARRITWPIYESEYELLKHNVPSNVRLKVVDPKAPIVPDNNEIAVAMLDLPRIMGTDTIEQIPAPIPYITVEEMTCTLPATAKRRVGLVWAGGDKQYYDIRRSVKLEQMAFLAQFAEQVEFVSLQLGHTNEHSVPVTHILHEKASWLDTASLVQQCDLIISVDTGVANLAAAMGKPTWVLSRTDPCWRWLGNRADNPWYPTARVFGQTTYNDWTDTIKELEVAFGKWLQSN